MRSSFRPSFRPGNLGAYMAVFAVALVQLAGSVPAALAQTAGGSVGPATPPSERAPGTLLETPDGQKPQGGTTTPVVPGNLSSTLSRSNGVLTPPAHVDPGMATAAPSTGPQSTPVIAPPGTPGGNQSVTPK